MSNLELYNSIFIKTFNVTEGDLDEEFTFKSVEVWDSLAHMHLIGDLEDEFDVLFETDEILRFGSYENGKRILERHGVSFE